MLIIVVFVVIIEFMGFMNNIIVISDRFKPQTESDRNNVARNGFDCKRRVKNEGLGQQTQRHRQTHTEL
jgi:hypothetical protein